MAGSAPGSTRARSARPSAPADAGASAADAAETALDRNRTALRLPLLGDTSLPPVDHLVWYAGVGVLTALELIEWPVALVLALGKVLADNRSSRTLRSFGAALEEAG